MVAISENEINLIGAALGILNDNPNSNIDHQEFIKLTPDIREIWFKPLPQNIKLCSICIGQICRLEITEHPMIPCPEGTGEVIDVLKEDRISYKFDMEKFIDTITPALDLTIGETDFHSLKGTNYLGETKMEQDEWKIYFTFSRTMERSFGDFILELYRHKPSFSLILVDKYPDLTDFQNSVLQQSGFYVLKWNDVFNSPFKMIYEQYEGDLTIRRDLLKEDVHEDQELLISTLKRVATTADGDRFEEEVFQVCRWIFQRIIQFGKEYKGFSIPDGLITDTRDKPLPLLFYDCKSFKGEEFKHKSETAMQVNYYEDFISKFLDNHSYQSKGFIIFSSSYPEKVQQSITESVQWKFVQEKCKIFFINVEGLERAKRLIDGYGDNASFNSHTFFDICFNESLSIDIDLENVLEKYYPKLFSASAYSAFRFLKADQLEVAMIAGFLSGHEDLQNDVAGLERKLSHLVKSAKHGNIKKGRIVKPTSSILLKTTTDHILANQKMNLHPLSSLLILNYYEEELNNNCGYERIEREKEILKDKLTSI